MEHEIEPVRGLPGHLPAGERILWQGGPDRAALARAAFHTRGVSIYFALLTALALGLSRGTSFTGTIATLICWGAAIALLHILAWAAARATIYTLTDKRVVLRIGVALPTCVNLPLGSVAAADLAQRADGTGDIALRLDGAAPLGWFTLWPHARAWRLARPEPMLRSIREADRVAALLARACLAAQPDGRATMPLAVQPATAAQPVMAPAPLARPVAA